MMTVQELIDLLNTVEDKSLRLVEYSGPACSIRYKKEMYVEEVDYYDGYGKLRKAVVLEEV